MKRFAFVVAVAGSLVSGCASDGKLAAGPGLEITSASALPPPEGIDGSVAERPYKLGPFDKIKVDVFGHEELSAEVQVDSAGSIALPMIGNISATGKTPAALAEEVAAGLRANFVREPKVAVNLVEAISQTITVDGAVREPGVLPVLGRMTLMRAIASAKGVTEFARLEDVVVFREVGGQRMAALYSLKGIRQGRYADPELFAGDTVVVGDSPSRRLFKDVASMGGLLTAPLVAVIR